MAKKNPGGGPGTYTTNGIRCTMDPPFKHSGKGPQQTMRAPFDAGRTGGDNGLPTRIYDDSGGPGKGASSSSRDSLGTIWTNPKGRRRIQGTMRP